MALLRSKPVSCSNFPITHGITVVALLAATSSARGQQPSNFAAKAQKSTSGSVYSVSLGAYGQFTLARTPVKTLNGPEGTTTIENGQGTSLSAGILGTFSQSFHPRVGYNINLGYTRLDETYLQGVGFAPLPSFNHPYPSDYFLRTSLGVNMYEVTIAYLIHGPETKRFDTFAQFGLGGVAFLPTNASYGVMIRPALVFGTGCDYALSKHWALRAEYRGLFYRNPGLGNVSALQMYTVSSEPAISLAYRFGGKR